MKRKRPNQDDFQYIAECIQELYDYCLKREIELNFLRITPVDITDGKIDDYFFTQLIWERAETYEISECLNPESIYYKGAPITKNEIMDVIIDIGVEELKIKKGLKKKKK